MQTIQFDVDSSVQTDSLEEIRLRCNDETMTIEKFLIDQLKSYARRKRIRAVNIDSIIDQTGL